MGIREWIGKRLGYPFPPPKTGTGGIQFFDMNIPPGWGYQTYLKAYGEVGWLYACVNVIANEVASAQWHLYKLNTEGEREESFQHPLIDFLNNINPIQSRYQFFYMGTLYKKLVGEQFWVLNFNSKGSRSYKYFDIQKQEIVEKAGQPAEMWLAPPAYMSVVPGDKTYIDRFEYQRPNMAQPIKFTTDEVIQIMSANPYNPYRGLSEAQALTTDIDSERYASRYTQKTFFNDATPGFIIKYPAADLPNAETRKELYQEFEDRYRGYRNKGKPFFSWGGEPSVITMTNKDMDYTELRKHTRDEILATYRVPPSILGITEHVNRANSEAAQYDFGMYAVNPELIQLREAMNKELVPFFGDNLYLDFDSPIPEDETAEINNSIQLFKSGLTTRNESRIYADLEPLPEGDVRGDEFFVQPSPFGKPEEFIPPAEQAPKQLKAPEQKELFWKGIIRDAEAYEPKTIRALKEMFNKWKYEAKRNIPNAPVQNNTLINRDEARKDYHAAMIPIMTEILRNSIRSGRWLLHPIIPHKQDIPVVISPQVIEWLKNRIGWVADEISGDVEEKLRAILITAYKEGKTLDQIANDIDAFFDDPYRSERIARTEIMMAYNQGAMEGYKDSGVVHKVEFYTAMDERTCELCNSMHGDIENIEDAPGLPESTHPNCRCVWLPIVD